MKKLENCIVENCIPTPASCVEWNGGNIDYLGICNGDFLTNVVWEIVGKLEDIAGDDLAEFDIDSLLTICNQSAPLEVNLISILTLLKNNDVCLKDYIDTLNEKINELAGTTAVNVNLKCYADFDNLGNSLSITREQLDQLVINELCNHKGRIDSLEGTVIGLQTQINNIDINPVVDELDIATCIDPVVKPTSTQVIITAQAHCDLEAATGTPADIASALAKTPSDLNAEFGLIPGWILVPSNQADNYNNLLLEVEALRQRLITIEETCCAIDCSDVKIGFTATFNEDNDGIIIRFTAGAGTQIPVGFIDMGSTITITDEDGNIEEYVTVAPDLIANNAQIEVPIPSLSLIGDVNINIESNMSNGSLTCAKCNNKTIKRPGCQFCVLTATDVVTVIYKICPTS